MSLREDTTKEDRTREENKTSDDIKEVEYHLPRETKENDIKEYFPLKEPEKHDKHKSDKHDKHRSDRRKDDDNKKDKHMSKETTKDANEKTRPKQKSKSKTDKEKDKKDKDKDKDKESKDTKESKDEPKDNKEAKDTKDGKKSPKKVEAKDLSKELEEGTTGGGMSGLTTGSKEGKAEKDVDKEEEKVLRGLDYYHGLMAREDLATLLLKEGDYLVRVTEVEGPGAAARNQNPKKEIILSLMTYCQEGEVALGADAKPADGLKQCNVIIRRKHGKYRVEPTIVFDSVKVLIEYYRKKVGTANKIKILLKTPIRKQEWEFSHTDVKLIGKTLGEGAYGKVESGKLKLKTGETVDVAVKMAKGSTDIGKAKIKEMMKEARLMRHFKHKNVVRFYGVAVLEQPLYIILELINGGGLNTYLRGRVGQVDGKEKMSMCLGAAQGLDYLHKNGCLHRDIAARNCLYTDEKLVKISDFGLSRLGSEYKISKGVKLPVKWLAPETMTSFTFSTKTDTYSYGVLVYEIYADGAEPWEGVTNGEVKKMMAEGKFLTLPGSCPDKLKEFIKVNIYIKDPNKRIAMSDVTRFLETLQTEALIVGSANNSPAAVNHHQASASHDAKKKKVGVGKIFRSLYDSKRPAENTKEQTQKK